MVGRGEEGRGRGLYWEGVGVCGDFVWWRRRCGGFFVSGEGFVVGGGVVFPEGALFLGEFALVGVLCLWAGVFL